MPTDSRVPWDQRVRLGQLSLGIVLLGAVLKGISSWYESWEMQRARYFEERCKLAGEQVPAAPVPAAGLLIQHPDRRKMHMLQAVRDDETFVAPPWRFEIVQWQEETPDGRAGRVREVRWHPPRSRNEHPFAHGTAAAPSMPYVLRLQPLAEPRDVKFKVQGLEATIAEVATGKIVARTTFFEQSSEDGHSSVPPKACRRPAQATAAACSHAPFPGCSPVHAFVFRALQPTFVQPPEAIFDLSREMDGRRSGHCSRVVVQPGLRPQDVEWWPDDSPMDRDLLLTVRGAPGVLVCPGYVGPSAGSLQFADGTQVDLEVLRQAHARNPSAGRRTVAQAREEVCKRVARGVAAAACK